MGPEGATLPEQQISYDNYTKIIEITQESNGKISIEVGNYKPSLFSDKAGILNVWWERLDLNQRRREPTDLQSAPFDRTPALSRMVGPPGLEPGTRRASTYRSTY